MTSIKQKTAEHVGVVRIQALVHLLPEHGQGSELGRQGRPESPVSKVK